MKKIILSICLACRDGCEYKTEKRGGKRLADKIFYKYNKNNFILRGVNCMSQCKRPCVISITSKNNFTYVFSLSLMGILFTVIIDGYIQFFTGYNVLGLPYNG